MLVNIAHRGARSLAPENTLLAARKAMETGADLWETDVSVTRDGDLMLFHDESLVRTTNVTARFPDRVQNPFASFTLEEIRQLDAGSWFVETDPFGQIRVGRLRPEDLKMCREQKVPLLEEGLLFTRDAGFRINIELKPQPPPMEKFPMPDRILSLLNRLSMPLGQVIISSFNHDWLREIRTRNPNIRVQALIGRHENKPLDWGNLEFGTYNVRSTLIEDETLAAIRARNIAVNLWTVNEEAEMIRFIRAGASGIFTDFPQRLSRLLKYKGYLRK